MGSPWVSKQELSDPKRVFQQPSTSAEGTATAFFAKGAATAHVGNAGAYHSYSYLQFTRIPLAYGVVFMFTFSTISTFKVGMVRQTLPRFKLRMQPLGIHIGAGICAGVGT